MGTATHYLSLTAQKLGIPYSFIDESHSVLVLHFPKVDHLVVNTKLGLISNADEFLGLDKAFQYDLLKDKVPLPKTKAYLDIHSKYGQFARFKSLTEIQSDIQKEFSFPLIVKKNRGTEGIHVFLVKNPEELQEKTATIFNQKDSEYDHVLLAQEYKEPAREYRVITYNQEIAFAYLKDNSQATFTGNLSPLHWEQARTIEITDPRKLSDFEKLCQKLFLVWPLKFAGLDLIEDNQGKLWLIEVNTAPSSAHFIKDNGEAQITKLYTQILNDLKAKYT